MSFQARNPIGMNEINCPECGKVFKVNEIGYANIINQVRDEEFEHEILKRLNLAEEDKVKSIELAKKNLIIEMQESVTNKDRSIQVLQSKLDAAETEKALAVSETKSFADKERDILTYKLEQVKINNEIAQKLAITKAVFESQKEQAELKSNLEKAELENQLAEKSLKEKYELQIKDRDNAIERLRDMKLRLSTKMVGESLEKHCETEFNRIRATAFPKAYFEKESFFA